MNITKLGLSRLAKCRISTQKCWRGVHNVSMFLRVMKAKFLKTPEFCFLLEPLFVNEPLHLKMFLHVTYSAPSLK